MAQPRLPQLPQMILDELDATGFAWEVTPGKKHWKIYVGGILSGIWPYSKPTDVDRRPTLMLRTNIRRTRDALRGSRAATLRRQA